MPSHVEGGYNKWKEIYPHWVRIAFISLVKDLHDTTVTSCKPFQNKQTKQRRQFIFLESRTRSFWCHAFRWLFWINSFLVVHWCRCSRALCCDFIFSQFNNSPPWRCCSKPVVFIPCFNITSFSEWTNKIKLYLHSLKVATAHAKWAIMSKLYLHTLKVATTSERRYIPIGFASLSFHWSKTCTIQP